MAVLPTYFDDFLKEVRPTKDQRDDLRKGHSTLRKRLHEDPDLDKLIVSSFLQGSYRRSTAVRPKNGNRSDVDIIVVTRIDKNEVGPAEAMGAFIPFLDKHYKDKYRLQGRSFGIELTYVEMDMVITAAPSASQEGILLEKAVMSDDSLEEATDWRLVKGWIPPEERITFEDSQRSAFASKQAEWKVDPLWIPDRELDKWDETHPLAQIIWTRDKNARCSKYYLGVVQAIKWWKRQFIEPAYPKGYPLEHLIGYCCPDGISSVAEGVTLTLEAMATYCAGYAALSTVPFLQDHGVPTHNVMGRVSAADFKAFHQKLKAAAPVARKAYNEQDTAASVVLWRELFGSKFPEAPETKQGGYSQRSQVSAPPAAGRFA